MIRASLLLLALAAAATAAEPIHHDLKVKLDPSNHGIEVVDSLSRAPKRFKLHVALRVTADKPWTVAAVGAAPGVSPLYLEYELKGPEGGRPTLRYRGKIHHPLIAEAQEYARSFSRSPGLITEKGAVLSGATYWVPTVADTMLTFRLQVERPDGWDIVSQGKRTAHSATGVTWECKHPMEEVYLIAAPFTEYKAAAGNVNTYAFLRRPDPALAGKYLETTAQYIEMYRKLLGRYPFAKFALVENFWETGYGMPSFTLLGQQIIRFPFILHSSYPHEILHNWWGNSVYVDWETGNWCEGLTAYLADHLIREGHGGGEAYRRDTLKKYRAYVRGEGDFPLRKFRSRHSSATEAIGYGKSLMLFHMLRIRLGDAKFVDGLRAFYRRFKYKQASFDDIAMVFTDVAGEDLKPFFKQWVERTGAPRLSLGGAADGLFLVQEQEHLYDLLVPVAYDGRVELVHVKERTTPLKSAQRVDVDPYFDVFRLLDRDEIPPTLGEVFGAEKVTLVLPKEGWRGLAEAWKGDNVEVVTELKDLPADRSVWIIGTDNEWKRALTPFLAARKDELAKTGMDAGTSFVYTAPHPANPELTIGWIGGSVPAAVPGLARKLPHYGKYSYLAFEGDEPSNVAKGQWIPTASPMVWNPTAKRKPLPKREPLARLAPVFDEARLMAHVRWLAADVRKGRGIGTPELDACAEYIAAAFKRVGLEPEVQAWTEPNGPDGNPVTLKNVIAAVFGTDPKAKPVVVGAHYDHLGLGWPDVREGHKGKIHNGADDNASGVAVLLELAKVMAREKPRRTIIFVAFSGEEWGLKGSRHFARSLPRKAFAMVNLDTVGRLGKNKLTLLGSGTATEWKHIAMGVGYTTGVEAVCIPKDPGGSDQVVFHEYGVPAVQLFTGAHEDYHRSTDTIDKVDGAGLVKVATFLRETVGYLAERDRPLTSTLGKEGKPKPQAGPGRRVSLGTLPDFAFPGPGIKIKSVLEGSPAEQAGLKEGDLLLSIDGEELKNLRAYSNVLKKHKPGDVIKIKLRRGDEELEVEATLRAR